MRPLIAAPQSRAPLSADSRCWFHYDAAETTVNAETGALRAITGHAGVFTRGATLAAWDSAGLPYTAQHAQPAWEGMPWYVPGDLDPVPAFGARMGTADRLTFPAALPWGAHKGMHMFVELGARVGTAGGTLLAYTRDDGTGAGWWIDTTGGAGGTYRMTVRDAVGATAIATLGAGSGHPVVNDRVVLTWQLTASGALVLTQSVNDAPPKRADGVGTIAWPAAPYADMRLRVNYRSVSAPNAAAQWHRRTKLVPGNPTPPLLMELR